jgi:hypothetical protein
MKALIFLVLLLSGCAGPLALVVNQDLDSANALAASVNDSDAKACFDALKKANTTSVGGFFVLLEQLRILHQARGPCALVLLP